MEFPFSIFAPEIMPLTKEKVPNLPLNGVELQKYAVAMVARECQERGLPSACAEALNTALANDCIFMAGLAYPSAEFDVTVRYHGLEDREAWSVDAEFRFLNLSYPRHSPFVRRPVGIAAPPLENIPSDQLNDTTIDAFMLSAKVINPNLVRVHCDIAVVITTQQPPAPGEVLGRFENHEIRYDPAEYPALPDPIVVDLVSQTAQIWGFDEYNRLSPIKPQPAEPETPFDIPMIVDEDPFGIDGVAPVPEVARSPYADAHGKRKPKQRSR